MEMTLRINSNQLNSEVLENIQNIFKDKEIEITVNEIDETEYLFRSLANKKHLHKAFDDVENNRNIVIPDQEQFQ